MTAPPGGPPGGPYGQDPYGQNPYGPNPWSGQPQGGPQPPVDPYGQTQHYPAGQPYGAPGGGYPPPGQYPGYPGYPGGPGGPGSTPPGPPRKSKTPWVIGAIAALTTIAILLAAVIYATRDDSATSAKGTSSLTTSAPVSKPPVSSTTSKAPKTSTSAPKTSSSGTQTATDCTPNVSGGTLTGNTVEAGGLSFPLSAAPGWMPGADTNLPNGIDVIGVVKEVPEATDWMMEAQVGITNFVPSMDLAEQASKLLTCVAQGPGYPPDVKPTLGTPKTSSIKVDGVEAARVDAEVTLGDTSRGIPGDALVVITVKTDPVTFFLSTSPIGDAESQAAVEAIIAALKVKR